MKNFIWDLDGTLFNSYSEIVSSLETVMYEYSIKDDPRYILEFVIRTSVYDYIAFLAQKYSFDTDTFRKKFRAIHESRGNEVEAEKHAKELLQWLCAGGKQNFIFTHRGLSSYDALKNLGMEDFFVEVITAADPFPRKPEPDALNYLIEKHGLIKGETCYVGDRTVDMQCARNAGVTGILYLAPESAGSPSGFETYIVSDLLEIRDII